MADLILEALASGYVDGEFTLEELERRIELHLRQSEVHAAMRDPSVTKWAVTPYGTCYTTCPDFPRTCAEFPGPCRGVTQGVASFRKIGDSDPTRR